MKCYLDVLVTDLTSLLGVRPPLSAIGLFAGMGETFCCRAAAGFHVEELRKFQELAIRIAVKELMKPGSGADTIVVPPNFPADTSHGKPSDGIAEIGVAVELRGAVERFIGDKLHPDTLLAYDKLGSSWQKRALLGFRGETGNIDEMTRAVAIAFSDLGKKNTEDAKSKTNVEDVDPLADWFDEDLGDDPPEEQLDASGQASEEVDAQWKTDEDRMKSAMEDPSIFRGLNFEQTKALKLICQMSAVREGRAKVRFVAILSLSSLARTKKAI